ncbi:MAG: hypothetical protein V1725_08115 [archaeon]
MDLQLREKAIFETLKKLENASFVLIGGYAVNTYTLPRFSVDCDIVVLDQKATAHIAKMMKDEGYDQVDTQARASYGGTFSRFEKTLQNNFKVSMDLLTGSVHDRQSGSSFTAEWIFDHASKRKLKGKTIYDDVTLHIINLDALIVMKFVSARSTDIRDVFMLLPSAKNTAWIKQEVHARTDFKKRFELIKKKVTSPSFRNDLQGVYGSVNKTTFEKHVRAVLSLSNP